ncbi:MAG: hypothetical protein FJY88_10420, partial [Candidatus Eisenbacteria bacterium]|nr:hypothetical protein [Candidatus Eisenbacteria bacterium]
GIAFDGGLLEISIDSLAYEPLVPAGGYTHTIHDRGYGGPFAEGTACYSGTFGWTRVEIDLSSYVGSIQIRFRFGSDSTGAGAGWTIDDIEVRGLDEAADAPDARFLSAGLVLDPAQPNPFETDARITLRIPYEGRVRLLIVDSSGRAVRTLMDETCVPGERSVVWDGRSDAGRALPSGVYYSIVRQDGARATGRMVLVK